MSARQEENELVIRLNNASLNNDNKQQQQQQPKSIEVQENSTNGDAMDVVKPRFGSWSEFSTRHSESPLPYW